MIKVGREEKKRKRQKKYSRAIIKTQTLKMNHEPCSKQLSRHLGTPKQSKDNLKDFASLPKTISTTTRYPSPTACHHPYCAHLPGRCVFCSCWIAHEARSFTASDICRAASRCESSGDEAAHAQSAFVSTFYVLLDLHLSTTRFPARPVGSGDPLE